MYERNVTTAKLLETIKQVRCKFQFVALMLDK